jgi:hypothetical protein
MVRTGSSVGSGIAPSSGGGSKISDGYVQLGLAPRGCVSFCGGKLRRRQPLVRGIARLDQSNVFFWILGTQRSKQTPSNSSPVILGRWIHCGLPSEVVGGSEPIPWNSP